MRLIDADALKARIMMDAPDLMDGGSSITKAFILAMLGTRSATPTIDAVSVVRCKYCKNAVACYDNEAICDHIDSNGNDEHSIDWFCADGVAKDNNVPEKDGR